MSQTPITITYSLEEIIKEMNGKLDKLNNKFDEQQKDVNDLKIGQTRLEEKFTGEMKTLETNLQSVKKDVNDLNQSPVTSHQSRPRMIGDLNPQSTQTTNCFQLPVKE